MPRLPARHGRRRSVAWAPTPSAFFADASAPASAWPQALQNSSSTPASGSSGNRFSVTSRTRPDGVLNGRFVRGDVRCD